MASQTLTRASSEVQFSTDFAASVPAYLARIRRHPFARWGRLYGLQADLEQLTLIELARIATRTGTLPAANDPHFSVVLTQRLSNCIRALKRNHRDIVDDSHLSIDKKVDGDPAGENLLIDEIGTDTVEAVERHQAIAALRRAIEALTARQREVIDLILAEMTEAEIAIELGVSVQAVNKTKLAAYARLRLLVPAEHAVH